MKTLTIYVLCHAHIRLALRAMKSIEAQLGPLGAPLPTSFQVRPFIMVNTNDLSFYQQVKDSHKDVLHSWSNGSPGAGKNACIRDWISNESTDYMMIIDGDDWLYPSALYYLWQAIKNNPEIDYLGLQTLDVVSPHKLKGAFHIRRTQEAGDINDLYLSTWGTRQPNMTEVSPRLLWMQNIVKFHSVARTVLISRNVISGYGITFYPEDMSCYEDMVYNAKLLCQQSLGVIKYAHISCSGIYIADHGVPGQVENHLYSKDHQTPYEYHVRPLEKKYGNLNFNIVPFMDLELLNPCNIGALWNQELIQKIKYINDTYDYDYGEKLQFPYESEIEGMPDSIM